MTETIYKMIIEKIDQQELEDTLARKLEENDGAKLNNMNGLYHLKQTCYEWGMENNWQSPRAQQWVARNDEGTIMGGTFITVTSRKPVHVTFRHIFLFEEARGHGVAETLYNWRYRWVIENTQCRRVRLFANKPATPWHNKCGMRFLGMNKAKQPFTYLPLFDCPSMRDYGAKLDSIGPRAAMDMVEPEVTKQVEKIVSKGGRWYTQEEFKDEWGSELEDRFEPFA